MLFFDFLVVNLTFSSIIFIFEMVKCIDNEENTNEIKLKYVTSIDLNFKSYELYPTLEVFEGIIMIYIQFL